MFARDRRLQILVVALIASAGAVLLVLAADDPNRANNAHRAIPHPLRRVIFPVMIAISDRPAGALTVTEVLRLAHPKHPNRPLPPGVTTYYGIPLGASRAHRVWGFRSRVEPCLNGNPNPPSPPPLCHEWTLVNAVTGRWVADIQQPVRARH